MAARIEILHEDDALLVINKPAGVLSVPGRHGGQSVREVLERQTGRPQEFRLVHRLDRDTSGVMVLAQTVEAQRALSEQWFERDVEKQYLAIVRGQPQDDSGHIAAPIGEDPKRVGRMRIDQKDGKPSETRWRVVERLGVASLVRCWPLTGRQHQIRVHMKLIGYPLLVDPLYTETEGFFLSSVKMGYKASGLEGERPLIGRLTLHAEAVVFRHPTTRQPVRFESPEPKDFRAVLTQLRKLRG